MGNSNHATDYYIDASVAEGESGCTVFFLVKTCRKIKDQQDRFDRTVAGPRYVIFVWLTVEVVDKLGVMDPLAKQLSLRGFKAPTPIQRSTIPLSLATPPRDVLGMARTGSGKTLAYVIPLLQRLGGVHRDTQGPRAIIMCPTRELALQIFKVGKDMARGLKQSKEEQGPLRWAIIIGGTSLDTQFESMSSSPDM